MNDDNAHPSSTLTGVLPVSMVLEIDAPAQDVWNIMLDFENYPQWNPFIRNQTLVGSPASPVPLTDQTDPKPGHYMLLHVHTPPQLAEPHFLLKPFQVSRTVVRLKVVDYKRRRLAWRTSGGFPEWLLWCERWQMVAANGAGDHACRYESYEVFGGLVAYLMWILCVKVLLLRGVVEMAEALSTRAVGRKSIKNIQILQ
ncbi:hypothetical protein D9757_003218 [Collybiopsis confluens]|uniref:Coenzyme Q-binding protein COQ10 START domain-containing protein n=1 Tax=Collybiopsis confluens TaxID=2823264 RepID=A0A8H5MFP4_9AGAR|nr:hypothetical protein D9757_003218 [Collybiopsis confluens]